MHAREAITDVTSRHAIGGGGGVLNDDDIQHWLLWLSINVNVTCERGGADRSRRVSLIIVCFSHYQSVGVKTVVDLLTNNSTRQCRATISITYIDSLPRHNVTMSSIFLC